MSDDNGLVSLSLYTHARARFLNVYGPAYEIFDLSRGRAAKFQARICILVCVTRGSRNGREDQNEYYYKRAVIDPPAKPH